LSIDAKLKPRELQYPTQQLQGWRVSGKLAEEWSLISTEIRSRTANDDFRLAISPNKTITSALRFTLYLVGKTLEVDQLRPTIVAESRDGDLAKKAAKALKQMQQYSLAPLLGSYDIHYAQVSIKLRAESLDDFDWPTDESTSKTICGKRALIQQLSGQRQLTASTIGGAVLIDGMWYALTAAHAFTDDTPQRDRQNGSAERPHNIRDSSGSFSGSDQKSLSPSLHPPSPDVRHHPSLVFSQLFDRSCIDEEDLTVHHPPVLDERRLLNGVSKHALVSRREDWALIPLDNETFRHPNLFRPSGGTWKTVEGVGSSLLSGNVYVATGISNPSSATTSGAASLLLIPGSDQLHTIWSIAKHSGKSLCVHLGGKRS